MQSFTFKEGLAFWSATSVSSDNVGHEATVAKQQGKLISRQPVGIHDGAVIAAKRLAIARDGLAAWQGSFDQAGRAMRHALAQEGWLAD